VFSGTPVVAAVVSLCAPSCGGTALAYRPFEGTDAAVADPGELEIEFGPAKPLREGRQRFLTARETVFNLGVARDWEVVLQGQAVTLLSPGPTQTGLLGDGHADGFLGAILEGPWDWPVRPVAEVFYDREWGVARTVSGPSSAQSGKSATSSRSTLLYAMLGSAATASTSSGPV
jgi:hypothetical protein